MISIINLDACDGCGVCVDVCPTDVLIIDEVRQKPVVRYVEDCMTCYNCEIECPSACIDVSPFRKPVPAILSHPKGVNRRG